MVLIIKEQIYTNENIRHTGASWTKHLVDKQKKVDSDEAGSWGNGAEAYQSYRWF